MARKFGPATALGFQLSALFRQRRVISRLGGRVRSGEPVAGNFSCISRQSSELRIGPGAKVAHSATSCADQPRRVQPVPLRRMACGLPELHI
jgi:hypothetical protein